MLHMGGGNNHKNNLHLHTIFICIFCWQNKVIL